MFETTNQIYKWVYLGDSPIFSYGFPVVFTRCFLAKKMRKRPVFDRWNISRKKPPWLPGFPMFDYWKANLIEEY